MPLRRCRRQRRNQHQQQQHRKHRQYGQCGQRFGRRATLQQQSGWWGGMDADDQRGWHSYKCEIVTRNQGDGVEEVKEEVAWVATLFAQWY